MSHTEPEIGSADLQVQHRWIRSHDTLGIYLGDLRALLTECEDLDDEALVTIGNRTSRAVRYADEQYVFELHVRDETRA